MIAFMPRMPAVFVGHGSPMNAVETNRYTRAWASVGATSPRPRAILVVSAHWYITHAAVTGMARPRTIHDFFGFPQTLFDVQYPAPGDAAFAEEIADVVKPTRVGVDRDGWGLDHGTWSVLVHMFPKADVPVVQLSIDARRPFDWHVALGAKLAPLRERGILIVGSGNVVHNLGAIDWSREDEGFDWAHRFDDAAREIMIERPADVASLQSHADFERATATPDHFIPLLYLGGLASAHDQKAQVLADGYAYGSLSMTCYGLQ